MRRLTGQETEYAIRFAPFGTDRPSNARVYNATLGALTQRVPAVGNTGRDADASLSSVFIANGGAFNYEATAGALHGGLLEGATPERSSATALVTYQRAQQALLCESLAPAMNDLAGAGYPAESPCSRTVAMQPATSTARKRATPSRSPAPGKSTLFVAGESPDRDALTDALVMWADGDFCPAVVYASFAMEKEYMGGGRAKMWTYFILAVVLVTGTVVANFALTNPDSAKDGVDVVMGLPTWAFVAIAIGAGMLIFLLGLKLETDWPEGLRPKAIQSHAGGGARVRGVIRGWGERSLTVARATAPAHQPPRWLDPTPRPPHHRVPASRGPYARWVDDERSSNRQDAPAGRELPRQLAARGSLHRSWGVGRFGQTPQLAGR